jgi:hypothetical protein
MVSVATRHPPDMDVLVDTHLPDSDRISVVIPSSAFLLKTGFTRNVLSFSFLFSCTVLIWRFQPGLSSPMFAWPFVWPGGILYTSFETIYYVVSCYTTVLCIFFFCCFLITTEERLVHS